MSILARYIGREILAATLLAALALVSLFSFFDFIGELGGAHAATYTPALALAVVTLGSPARLYEVMPVALLIGALFTWNRLALHAEFNVMRAGGLGLHHLAGWMLALGLAVGGATLMLGEFVVPHAEQAAKQLKTRATTGVVAREFKTGLWAKDGNLFINVRELRPDASLHGVRLFEFDQDFRLLAMRSAAQATWADGEWRLRQVTETRIDATRTETTHRDEMAWRSAVTPDLLAVLMVAPERMAITTLHAYSSHLRANQQDALRYEIAFWNKLIYPVAGPIMLLLALAFAYRPPRSGGAGARLLLGVLIGMGFHLANRLVAQIAQLLDWPPSAAALLPVLLAAGLALGALYWLERR